MHAREREREAASLLRVSNTGEAPFSRKTFLFRRAQNARDSTRFELAGARRSTTRLSLALFNNYSQGCRCVETLCARVYACVSMHSGPEKRPVTNGTDVLEGKVVRPLCHSILECHDRC